MTNNKVLRYAAIDRHDEFYTKYEDIEKELSHYSEQFKGKTIYCNCDEIKSNYVGAEHTKLKRVEMESLVKGIINSGDQTLSAKHEAAIP